MDISINDTIKYFTQSSIQFTDLFTTALPANTVDGNRFTAPYCNGLVFTLSGQATFSLNGVEFELNKQTALHAGPSMLINITTPPNTSWEYIVIHFNTYKNVPSLANEPFTLELGDNNKVSYFIQQLMQYNKLPGDLMHFKCQLYFMQLIDTILVGAKMQNANNFVDHALSIMIENYYRPLSINEIAETIGCERRKLSYLFEKQTGMTPIQYLTEYRLKQAKNLLRSTQLPIGEIAQLVGYSDIYYFCRVFKKNYAMTPTQYRRLS